MDRKIRKYVRVVGVGYEEVDNKEGKMCKREKGSSSGWVRRWYASFFWSDWTELKYKTTRQHEWLFPKSLSDLFMHTEQSSTTAYYRQTNKMY